MSRKEGNPTFASEDEYVRNCPRSELDNAAGDTLITQIGVIKPDATAGRGFPIRG
jgi:hypothetical protein